MALPSEQRFCPIHRSLFDRLFEQRSNETKWILTAYAKHISREGRLPTSFLGRRRGRRQNYGRRSNARSEPLVGIAATQSFCQSYNDNNRNEWFDINAAIEIDRVNRDPLRDVLVFAASNQRLFTVGCERSVASVYRSLWRLLYNSPKFAQQCICTNEVEYGARTVHVARAVATFPWRSSETLTRFAYNGAHANGHGTNGTSSTVSIQARPSVSYDDKDGGIEVARLRAHPYDDMFIQRMHSVTSEWWCDVSLAWARESRHDLNLAVKLLDHRFEDARQAWALVFDVMDWCERTHQILNVYPVRQSVWDLLVLPSETTVHNTDDTMLPWYERVVSGSGLVDVGDICAYAYSLRILMLVIYLGCSYGGMSRAASANDRVSNRFHRCVFPKKTSGVYYALFHTSILPHRIFCCYRDVDALPTTTTTTTTESPLDTTAKRAQAVAEATRWLTRFECICANASERYKLPRRNNNNSSETSLGNAHDHVSP